MGYKPLPVHDAKWPTYGYFHNNQGNNQINGGPSRVRPGFRRAPLVAGRTPEHLARAGANAMLVGREVHESARAIEGYWMFTITNEEKWWAQ